MYTYLTTQDVRQYIYFLAISIIINILTIINSVSDNNTGTLS